MNNYSDFVTQYGNDAQKRRLDEAGISALNRPADAGAPLPVGSEVQNSPVPGLYNSVHDRRLGDAQTLQDPTVLRGQPSRFTLRQMTPSRTPDQIAAGRSAMVEPGDPYGAHADAILRRGPTEDSSLGVSALLPASGAFKPRPTADEVLAGGASTAPYKPGGTELANTDSAYLPGGTRLRQGAPASSSADLLKRASFDSEQRSADVGDLSHIQSVTALQDKSARESKAIGAAHKAIVAGTDPIEAYMGKGGGEASVINALRENKPEGPITFQTDPVTGTRLAVGSKGNFAVAGKTDKYPKDIDAGGGVMLREVSPGRFTDTKGKPVQWNADEDRLRSLHEFWASPDLMRQHGNSYQQYVTSRTRELKAAMNAPADASGGAAPAPVAGAAAGPPTVKSRQERDALPAGAAYVGPDGKTWIKK